MDLSRFELPVLRATEAEAAAHAKMLTDLDKAAGGPCKWRSVEPAEPVA